MAIRVVALLGWMLCAWVLQLTPAFLLIAASIAVITTPYPWLRRTAVALIVTFHLISVTDDLVLLTLAEAALLAPFLETRLWRWSLAPGILLAAWLLFHVLPGGYGSVGSAARITWLFHSLVLLCASCGWRSIKAELDEDRALARR